MTISPQVKIRTLFLLILLAAFPPLSTDMYLPILPSLSHMWGVPAATINLSLVGFFASFSLALLIYGPLSDRFGRKPVLMAGIGLYIIACLVCALSSNPMTLIIGRVLQGFGAAAASTLSLAMTKDCFHGAERVRVMAHIAVIVALAPMLAPVIGGIMLKYVHWSGIFILQAFLGLIAMGGVARLQEPVSVGIRTLQQVLGNYFHLMCNLQFMGLCCLMALGMMPFFCFIGGSSYIFISHFGLSEQVFSYFFAFNSAALMLGAWICGRLIKILPNFRIIMLGYVGMLGSAIALALCANMGPWGMAIPMAIFSMFGGISRPPSNNFLLEQVTIDAGSASSLIMFTYFVSGAIAMWLIALPWTKKILVLGLVGVCSSILVLVFLPVLGRRKSA
ncbi:MAG: multidrug effflux MFS transporter [Desulfovibrionales bacterium]|nr:multidrug effflux MFS transporter [Desulfovibrionales bacterium]